MFYARKKYEKKELWRGIDMNLNGQHLTVTVPKKDAAIYRITSVHAQTEADSTEEIEMVITDSDNKPVKEKNGMLPYILGGAAVVIAAAAAVVMNKNRKNKE